MGHLTENDNVAGNEKGQIVNLKDEERGGGKEREKGLEVIKEGAEGS